jgi:hypothetical protein
MFNILCHGHQVTEYNMFTNKQMFNICQGGCVELVTSTLAYREGVGTSEYGLEYELAIRDVWSAAEQMMF